MEEKNQKKIKELKAVLKKIPNEFKEKDYTIDLFTKELTALCPFTGQPDFYEIHIHYIPNKELLELKSLKFYLQGFRDVKTTHETLLNIIFEDFVNLVEPKYLKIKLYVNVRGGIKTIVAREQGSYLEKG
ncbi:MAG: NADPH-dependent 7-cyano-7-deazaguanine reductase QueF [Deltaproteobacteria bacterium]|nr:MAG: NADPH-dependent 7-cyano-7-deazaguanine reductase QueF [Deltaproteobacteria bacterium]